MPDICCPPLLGTFGTLCPMLLIVLGWCPAAVGHSRHLEVTSAHASHRNFVEYICTIDLIFTETLHDRSLQYEKRTSHFRKVFYTIFLGREFVDFLIHFINFMSTSKFPQWVTITWRTAIIFSIIFWNNIFSHENLTIWRNVKQTSLGYTSSIFEKPTPSVLFMPISALVPVSA